MKLSCKIIVFVGWFSPIDAPLVAAPILLAQLALLQFPGRIARKHVNKLDGLWELLSQSLPTYAMMVPASTALPPHRATIA
jgi:hypothetical protein